MHLTSEQEAKFLKKFDPFIWKVVRRYANRCPYSIASVEDMHSECVLVVLEHLRTAPDPEAAERLPVLSMNHALTEYVQSTQVLSCPKRTSNFKKVINKMPTVADPNFDWFSLVSDRRDIDEVVERIGFEQFVDTLPDHEREMMRMKMEGMTNRTMAQHYGVPDYKITRELRRIQQKYEASVA